MGRQSKFKEEYCEQLIDHMSQGNKSLNAFSKKIGISVNTVIKWTRDIPEFKEAYIKGKQKYDDFWNPELW